MLLVPVPRRTDTRVTVAQVCALIGVALDHHQVGAVKVEGCKDFSLETKENHLGTEGGVFRHIGQ